MSTPASHLPASTPNNTSRIGPSGRVMGLIAFVLILLVGVVAMPSFGFAQNVRSGNSVTIKQGENITGDLYIAAGTFDFGGQVSGDANVTASQAKIGGTIHGSVNLATGTTTISGSIGGSAHIVSGKVTITGHITGDLVVAGGQVDLASNGRIDGNVYLTGGQVRLNGTVIGKVSGSTGSLTLAGTNQGSVSVNTGDLTIANTARLNGHITYTSRNDADVSDHAQVSRGITQNASDPWGSGDHVLGRASGSLLRVIWALIAGAVLIGVAPRAANGLGASGRRVVRSLITGVIGLIAIPLLIFVLLVTLIGIPAAGLVFVLFLVALYLSQVVVGMAIGRFLLPRRWNDGSRGFHLLAMALGVILLGATRFVPVPYVHAGIMLLVTIWGLGATISLLDPLFGGRQNNDGEYART